ncbi:MAG: hypothetical protein JXR88_03660 [Clostridia bacterium]|nr:hypothetical protein [Clostridia bacterium]
MFNEDKLEADVEQWLTEVGSGIGRGLKDYSKVLFKGVGELLSLRYMGKKDRISVLFKLLVNALIVTVLLMKAEDVTKLYSDFLKQYEKEFLNYILYKPLLTKAFAIVVAINFFHSLGIKKLIEEENMHELFEEIRFFTGKKRVVYQGDEKLTISETPRLIRKVVKDSDTTIYMFQSKGILPEEWEKRKDQLEYILEGKVVNFKRGKGKSMKLTILSEEKFEELNESYRRMEAFDEDFERMNLVGKGMREVEVFGEIKKTKNYPQFIKESSVTINGKVVLTTVFKSSGLTLDDFKGKRYEYENVMNRLVVEMSQDKLDKQIYNITTIDTKDELKELYKWSDEIIDERDGVLVLGEGRLEKVTLDVNETPHVLTGGVTGSGKSVLSNCLVYQGIKKGWYPILIDFKGGLELGMFERFSNTGVLYEYDKVYEILDKLNKENNARLEEFKKYPGVKNIVAYNKRVPEELKLARIIVTIDELSEMLDTTGKNKKEMIEIQGIEGKLNSLARLSRSTGINLLTGTQRPDSNVLKGQIKNNLGARICGRMTDKEPSIMVLGSPDATKLPESVKGRYMFSVGSDPVIMQGYFFEESDIKPGNYLKGRLLTMDVSQQSYGEQAKQEKAKSNSEPYEDFEDTTEDDSTEYSKAQDSPDEEDNTDEETSYSSAEQNYKNVIEELVELIQHSNPMTLRALKAIGGDHETLLDLLLEIYEDKRLSEEKQEQLKLLLFKEKKIDAAEYGGTSKKNAEPIL